MRLIEEKEKEEDDDGFTEGNGLIAEADDDGFTEGNGLRVDSWLNLKTLLLGIDHHKNSILIL